LVPSSFHAAWIYERYFQFVDPLAQGRFEALRYSWRLRPLWLLSWAIALGCARAGDGRPYAYAPGPMLCPLTDALARVLEARAYVEAVRREAVTPYEIDWARLRERFPWEQMPPEPPPERLRAVLGTRPKPR
ncbi:MAG TPA: deacetylase, partial [Myxococcaceae bacterium]|nr:deacetylase [Myxococcaceae bacterium]